MSQVQRTYRKHPVGSSISMQELEQKEERGKHRVIFQAVSVLKVKEKFSGGGTGGSRTNGKPHQQKPDAVPSPKPEVAT